MISLSELNPHDYDTTPEIDTNLHTLLERLNSIRSAWGKPMLVTSGLRSKADQDRINPAAPKSKHLIGAAADISDPNLELNAWLKGEGASLMAEVGLWGEAGTTTWTHLQCIAPGSGRRWFNP